MSSKFFRMLSILLIVGMLAVPTAVLAEDAADTIHGKVFYDENQDGVFDTGEVGIFDVTVELYPPVGPMVTTQTDVEGNYEFTGLAGGDYTVVEIDPVDYVSTTANVVDLFLDGETPVPAVNFGDVPVAELGSISGTVYHDLDRSRDFNTGDDGLEGVTVNLKNDEGVTIKSELTDEFGNYSFTDLFPGIYVLREQDLDGYYSTTPHEATVELLPGEVVEDVDFGDFIPEEGEVSPIDLPITRFFDLPLLDILEMRSIDGFGYGNIAKVYFLAYLGDMTVQEILDLYNAGMGWGNIMKEALGKAGLKGYNLGLIMSGREVPNQVQKMIDGCSLVETQEQVQELMKLGANQGTIKKLCGMVEETGRGYEELMNAVKFRSDGMKWKEIQDYLENLDGGAAESTQGNSNDNNNGNGPPACKGKNKKDPECK